MKKILGISLALILVTAVFMSCGGGGNDTTTSQTQATTSAAATTSSAAATSSKPATTSAAPTTSLTSTPPSTTPKTTAASSTPASSTTSSSGNDLSSLLGKAAGYSSYSCDMVMTGSGTTMTAKYWIKMGNPMKFKMEQTVDGETTVTIFNGTTYYLYMPADKTAMAMSVPPAKPSDASSTTQYNPVYIGAKTVNGYACAGYQYTASGVVTTMWISTQYGVVVEMVTSSGTVDYSNFNFSALADSTFELPPGTTVVAFPGM